MHAGFVLRWKQGPVSFGIGSRRCFLTRSWLLHRHYLGASWFRLCVQADCPSVLGPFTAGIEMDDTDDRTLVLNGYIVKLRDEIVTLCWSFTSQTRSATPSSKTE